MVEVPDSHRDLLDSECATLATVGPDGRPQLSEVWFLATALGVTISLNTTRQKTHNLWQKPGCSLLILDLANPYRYLELRGDAVLAPDEDLAVARLVGAKYGTVLTEFDRPGDGRVVVTLHPTRIRAVDMRAGSP